MKNVKKHAEILVNHSTKIEKGDMVVISASPEATDLVEEIYKLLGEIGAIPHLKMRHPEATGEYYNAIDKEDLIESEHSKALWEKADVSIGIRSHSNTKSLTNVPQEIQITNSKINNDAREARLDTRWVLTQYPSSGEAQEADMSTREYREFVYDAIIRDWDEQKEFQSEMCEILDKGKEVKICSGDKTNLTMKIDGMNAINDYGENNMPGGEVFTAPVKDSVNGTVLFDMPLITNGKELDNVYLEFENGKVVDYSADKNEDVLESILNTDSGAKYLGELGIGMNRGITEFTYNMLFDEKMGDTIHLALGRAYDDNVGDGNEQNKSAIHMDMIVDMSKNSYIEIDGKKIQENGEFSFE